jgi:O-antigen/teichoic acid export membrane protein
MKRQKENKKLNSSLRSIARSSVIVFIGIIISKILTYVYKIIIAREFGPKVYGLFSLAIMSFVLHSYC